MISALDLLATAASAKPRGRLQARRSSRRGAAEDGATARARSGLGCLVKDGALIFNKLPQPTRRSSPTGLLKQSFPERIAGFK